MGVMGASTPSHDRADKTRVGGTEFTVATSFRVLHTIRLQDDSS